VLVDTFVHAALPSVVQAAFGIVSASLRVIGVVTGGNVPPLTIDRPAWKIFPSGSRNMKGYVSIFTTGLGVSLRQQPSAGSKSSGVVWCGSGVLVVPSVARTRPSPSVVAVG
jgi:hypothetical protein